MVGTGQLYAVIPAGGSGTRLWPLSRANRPKFLHDLDGGGRSLLQTTVDRLAPLVALERVYVVTGASHAVDVARQLPGVPTGNILIEPTPRGTAAAIGLAAAVIARTDPTAIMGSFHADHLIGEAEVLRIACQRGIEAARAGYLVTIGVQPTAPETGFGYLRRGAPLGQPQLHEAVCAVDAFHEKPDSQTAAAYVASGDYLWNSGIFLWRVDVFLAQLAAQLPDLHRDLSAIADAWDGPMQEERLARLWPGILNVSVDHGIMEHAPRVAVVPASFSWSDLGDWASLYESLRREQGGDADGNVFLSGEHIVLDCAGSLLGGSSRIIAALGVRDLIVIDTEDAVLVCPRSRAQDVRLLVQKIRARTGDSHL